MDGPADQRSLVCGGVQKGIAAGASRLILDLSAVTFMDSSGIAGLIDTLSIATVTLRKPSDTVAGLIATTGLTNTFSIEP